MGQIIYTEKIREGIIIGLVNDIILVGTGTGADDQVNSQQNNAFVGRNNNGERNKMF